MNVSSGLNHGVTHQRDGSLILPLLLLFDGVLVEVLDGLGIVVDSIFVIFEHLVNLCIVVFNHKALFMHNAEIGMPLLLIIKLVKYMLGYVNGSKGFLLLVKSRVHHTQITL